jgi:hypothetical protein
VFCDGRSGGASPGEGGGTFTVGHADASGLGSATRLVSVSTLGRSEAQETLSNPTKA